MNIELCKQEIKRHEGEVLEIYMDSLGYKTKEFKKYYKNQMEELGLDVFQER